MSTVKQTVVDIKRIEAENMELKNKRDPFPVLVLKC